MFQEGNKLGGRTLGAKNKSTLLKEERRALFDQWMTDKFKQAVDTAKPEYLLDQYLGKPVEKIELTAEVKTIALTPEQVAKINEVALDDTRGTDS